MKTFVPIYNMVSSQFIRGSRTLPTRRTVELCEDFVSLPAIEANDLEEAFEILNIRIPTEFSDSVKRLYEVGGHETYPRLHTSMSVGDILAEITPEGPVLHFCDDIGWKELK